jgi:hypothetical protein
MLGRERGRGEDKGDKGGTCIYMYWVGVCVDIGWMEWGGIPDT